MDKLLKQRMQEKDFNDRTIHQRLLDLKKYFGSPPNFKKAWEFVCAESEVHKRSNRANKVASILNLMPELRPSAKEYEEFRKLQKEWNKKKNEYYAKGAKDTKVSKREMNTLVKQCEDLSTSHDSLKKMREYLLCQLYLNLPSDVLRSFEMRTLKIKKEGNSRKQNYLTVKNIVIGDNKTGKSIRVELPQKLVDVVNQFRKMSSSLYIFGGDEPLSQPAFSLMQKRVMGYSAKELRDLKQFQN